MILPQAIYRRAKEPSALPKEQRLIALDWACYFAVNGTHTVAEIGKQLRAETAARDESFDRLMTLGLIVEQELDAAEYVRALAASGDHEEKTLREFLAGAVQPPHTMPIPRATLRAARPAPPFTPLAFPQQPKENRPMSGSRQLSLRALMNLIEKQAGSREAGQLDIYRVFVRVDTLLLKKSGIETLRFTEDRLVSDPELEKAIVKSVKKTLGLDCPESVWVEVA